MLGRQFLTGEWWRGYYHFAFDEMPGGWSHTDYNRTKCAYFRSSVCNMLMWKGISRFFSRVVSG